MKAWIERVKRVPWIAHLLRAVERFTGRLGNQFAAAITYFSVLALVPIIMFAFSLLGMTLTVLRPSLLGEATDLITAQLQNADSAEQIVAVVKETLENWQAVGIVAILSAAYAGAGWVANLKQAVNAMWRKSFDVAPRGGNVVVETLKNLGILIGLMVLGGLTVVVSVVATAARKLVLSLLGLGTSTAASVLTSVLGVVVSLLTGWLLFVYLYSVLPRMKRPFRAVAKGALLGSLGLAALQYFAGFLTGVFSTNRAAVIFGPVIVLMLSLNLFATIVMIGAAWTATAADDAEFRQATLDPGEPDATLEPLADTIARAEAAHAVPEKVARRGATISLGAGYVLGGAAGVGLGAVIGRVLAGIAHRKRRG